MIHNTNLPNIKFTPFTIKYKNKTIILMNIKICGRTYVICDDSDKIFLVQK